MYNFENLPTHGIIFIDNCIFSSLSEGKVNLKNILEEQTKFAKLLEKLPQMNNWLIIPEILYEFGMGTADLCSKRTRIKRSTNSNINPVKKSETNNRRRKGELNFLINQRDNFLERILREDIRDATENLIPEQYSRVQELLEHVEQIFIENGGEPDKRNTDCRLIATALVYAEGGDHRKDPVHIFSYDKTLSRTFACSARELDLDLRPTHIINKNGRIIQTWKYH
jgi:hypothetical protein